jgi:plasmid stability protein
MITVTIKGIPGELHRELKEQAEENGRSLNTEIIARLRVSSLKGRRRPVEEVLKEGRL